MKKFLIAILLICTCIIPKFADGFDKSETCYQFVSGSGDRLAKILDKYFGDGHGGYKDENKKKAVKYFFRSLEQSEESSINCLEVVRVCVLGKLNDTKCEDFITELQAAWKESSVKQQTKKTQTPVSESVTLKEETKGSVSKENKKTESKEAFADSLRSKMRKNSNSKLDDEVDELVERQRKYCKAAGCSYDETGYCHVEIIDVGKTSVYCNGKTKYFDDSFNEIKPVDSKKDADDDPCAKIEQEKDGFKRLELNKACCIKECGTAIGCSIYNGYIYCPEKK